MSPILNPFPRCCRTSSSCARKAFSSAEADIVVRHVVDQSKGQTTTDKKGRKGCSCRNEGENSGGISAVSIAQYPEHSDPSSAPN
jgi:hypothetical protein